MKKLLYITVFIFIVLGSRAQQVGMYNHFFYKPLFYNPAYAGNQENIEAMMLNRSQWSSFNNAPQLNIFTIDGAVKEKKLGLGLTLISDKRGINRRTGGNVSYSYHANVNDDVKFLFGLSTGFINHSIDYSKVVTEDYSDVTLFPISQQKTAFDMNAGFAFIYKGLDLNFSVPQVLGNKVNYVDDTSGVHTYYQHARHFLTSVKYKINLSKEKGVSLTPQAMVRIVPNAPLQYEGNLNLMWQNKFWLGATYKSNYAVSANAGITIYKQLDIGYSYEFITGSIGSYSGMSHEIMVTYKFGRGKKNDDEVAAVDSSKIIQQEKNLAYEQRMDSLREVLEENIRKVNESQKKINDLNAKLEEVKKTQAQQAANQQNNNQQNTNSGNNTAVNTNTGNNQAINNNATNNNNTSGSAISPNWNKTREGNVLLVTNNVADYVSPKKTSIKKGIYIIVGTFVYDDFAMNEVKRLKSNGFAQSSFIYSKSQQYNYVYTNRFNDKGAALEALKKVRASGMSDAWIKIVE